MRTRRNNATLPSLKKKQSQIPQKQLLNGASKDANQIQPHLLAVIGTLLFLIYYKLPLTSWPWAAP